MPKFILSSIDEENGDKVTHEFNALHINTVFERFEDFLRGCGYVFDGHIEVINDVQEPEVKFNSHDNINSYYHDDIVPYGAVGADYKIDDLTGFGGGVDIYDDLYSLRDEDEEDRTSKEA